MANIPLLYPGCTAQEILDTINALIAAITGGAGRTMSYSELENKPTVNGVVIEGDLTTENLLIAIADTVGYDTMLQALATKAYADTVKSEALASAQNAVNAALAGKLDKDLSNLNQISYTGDNASVLVFTPDNRLCRVSVADMAAYMGTKNAAVSQEKNMRSQRTTIELTGAQNGSNLVFTTETGYTLGTSALYLNGNRLYADLDYREDNYNQITFRTYIPVATDIILFEAIPLPDARQ